MVVFISEVAKKSDRLGGLIAALPLVTVLTLIWLYLEKQPESKIANHAWYTFWYVIPTLPMFLAFPFLLLPMFLAFPFLLKRFGFWPTLGISVVITLVTFYIFAKILKSYGIELL